MVLYIHVISPVEVIRNRCLTVCESWWVIVDISKRDCNRCGTGEAAHLAHHIFGLNDQHILVSCLSIHVGQGCSDDTCEREPEKMTNMIHKSKSSCFISTLLVYLAVQFWYLTVCNLSFILLFICFILVNYMHTLMWPIRSNNVSTVFFRDTSTCDCILVQSKTPPLLLKSV